ncbi:GNAT family N-acetyltransferase, partial [Xanthomonas citri pv. citri]|nr:GNAT family N-acetyltransferase [Xanthomonas citri pv. citri]
TALLTAAEDTLIESGAETIGLEVMADNEAAHSFYQSNGYSPHRIELEKSTENDTL